MEKIICDIFMYIFEALLLYNYANDLFSGTKKPVIKISAVALMNLILFSTYQTRNTPLNSSALIILYFLVLWLAFGAEIKVALFHTILFISVMSISEIIVINLCAILNKLAKAGFPQLPSKFNIYI